MSFSGRITRCPIPFDPEPAAEARQRFAGEPGEIRELLAGAAGCSPYLAGLMARQDEWLRWALAEGADAALADATGAALDGQGSEALGPLLRRAKARVALLAGLADLGGIWPLADVTGALTRLADRAVDLGMKALVGDEIRRGRVPGAGADDAGVAAGMVALAMGKAGAGELNYSSDIDLILLFDETRFAPEDTPAARAAFIRVARRLASMLGDLTPEGYVFRTDLRLRPDAAVTPVCISMGAAEQYYEAQGRTWERAAYIKARAAAGDIAAGERFLKVLTPFVWRRHLDFAAIRDAHDMRLRIRDHKGLHGRLVLDGHDLKLGQGGIREIEFFTQTRQLIAGGRDPGLRQRATVPALAALCDKGWVPPDVTAELQAAYEAHREIEHRLQMVSDAQTHALPATPDAWDRIARMTGEGDTARLRRAIRERLERVGVLTESFFAPGEARQAEMPRPEQQAIVDGWRAYPALRSERAVAIFKRVEPEIISRLSRAANPEEALRQFDGFLAGLPAGVQLFALFEANPQLVELIVDICATAPALAAHLSRNAGVLDSVIGGDFFTPWPGADALADALTQRLSDIADYERKLDAARAWAKEWRFRVGVHHLRGLTDAPTAGREYADVADAVVRTLWGPCLAEFARKHGTIAGRGAVVVGMGSLGAGRLTAASDLDLIVIYDAPGDAVSDGARALDARSYFARLTQAFVTALSAPMAEGRLYEVDMRLRPSGRQGPVAVSLGSFLSYQLGEAWTWEHLALTRARVIAGEASLTAEVEARRRDVLAAKAGGSGVVADTAEMRERIFAAKAPEGAWDAKTGPGRMQDIDLFAQSLALRAAAPARNPLAQLETGVTAGLLAAPDAARIGATYRLLWQIQTAARLLTDKPLDPATVGEGARAFLLRATGEGSIAALSARLTAETGDAARLISRYLAEATAAGASAGQPEAGG